MGKDNIKIVMLSAKILTLAVIVFLGLGIQSAINSTGDKMSKLQERLQQQDEASTKSSDATKINKDDWTAVFLNGGQVYFGKVEASNVSSLSLVEVYYLRGNANGQNFEGDDLSLVKLGCELHGPNDKMLIYKDQVQYLETLKDEGQVVKAIAAYKQANPTAQNCDV